MQLVTLSMKIRIYLPYDILLEIGSSLSLLQLNMESEKKTFLWNQSIEGVYSCHQNKLNLLT